MSTGFHATSNSDDRPARAVVLPDAARSDAASGAHARKHAVARSLMDTSISVGLSPTTFATATVAEVHSGPYAFFSPDSHVPIETTVGSATSMGTTSYG